MYKQILVVAHNRVLNASRVSLLERAGYQVHSVGSDDEAMRLLESVSFDLVVIGRRSQGEQEQVDERLRTRHPGLLVLQIENEDRESSAFASRVTDSQPLHVLAAVEELLSDPEAIPC